MGKTEVRKIELKDFYFGPVNLLVMPKLEVEPKLALTKKENRFRAAPAITFKGHN